MPKQVQRILFIRLSAIGDIVMASGLPSSIKEIYSNDAQVTWLVEEPYISLVKDTPYIDHVISWPKSTWVALYKNKKYWQLLKAIWTFRHTLRAGNFTLAIDAQGLLKSAFLAYLSGASMRVGFKSKEKSHYLLTHSTHKPISNFISSEYRHLSRFLATSQIGLSRSRPIETPTYEMCIRVNSQIHSGVTEVLRSQGVQRPFIAIAPFTTRPQKHWPMSHWKRLITLIRGHLAIPIVVLGGPHEAIKGQELVTHSKAVISLAGKISLAQSAAVVAQCHAFVGVDTGLTHLADAYQKPTLALFGSTRPYTQTDNSQTHVIFKNLACAPCKRRPTCNSLFDCMHNIMPEEVFTRLSPYITNE